MINWLIEFRIPYGSNTVYSTWADGNITDKQAQLLFRIYLLNILWVVMYDVWIKKSQLKLVTTHYAEMQKRKIKKTTFFFCCCQLLSNSEFNIPHQKKNSKLHVEKVVMRLNQNLISKSYLCIASKPTATQILPIQNSLTFSGKMHHFTQRRPCNE